MLMSYKSVKTTMMRTKIRKIWKWLKRWEQRKHKWKRYKNNLVRFKWGGTQLSSLKKTKKPSWLWPNRKLSFKREFNKRMISSRTMGLKSWKEETMPKPDPRSNLQLRIWFLETRIHFLLKFKSYMSRQNQVENLLIKNSLQQIQQLEIPAKATLKSLQPILSGSGLRSFSKEIINFLMELIQMISSKALWEFVIC